MRIRTEGENLIISATFVLLLRSTVDFILQTAYASSRAYSSTFAALWAYLSPVLWALVWYLLFRLIQKNQKFTNILFILMILVLIFAFISVRRYAAMGA